MVKVDVISGFLGAGKTTLIKKLFSERMGKERIALIENEFGEIGIDSSFLKESGVDIKEINSGCICCSLVGNFEKSLKEMIDTYSPDRIIIEPSGVGKLSDIVKAIDNTGLNLEINILCTVVDGGKCKMYLKNFGEFYTDQVKSANVIVVSKADVISEEKVAAAVELVKQYNDKATFITTPIDQLDGATLLKNLEGNGDMLHSLLEEMKHHHHHHHDHDHGHCQHEEDECCCGHHHDHDHGHHHHEGEECCCGHHHDHEHGHCQHEEDECCCGHHHEHEHHHHEGEECCCGHHHEHEHHHHEHGECDDPNCSCHDHHGASDVFDSWGKETNVSYTESELNGILNSLCGSSYGMVLRAKGVVNARDNEGWYHFDLVAGEFEIRVGSADAIGKICVIGSGIDKEGIAELFLR